MERQSAGKARIYIIQRTSKNMKSWLKGGLTGLIVFIISFVVLSLINTGKISIREAFGFEGAEGGLSIINYILVLIFVLLGILIGWYVGRKK